MFCQSLLRRLKSFRDDEAANVSIEFVMAMPFLFWAFMATYVYFDGYRQSSVNLKAAFTIGDLISRETEPINEAYMDSMYQVLRLMTRARSPIAMRVTVIRWDEADDRYYVIWSEVRNGDKVLDDSNIAEIASRLPIMPDNDRVILVETENTFVPLFGIGMEDQTLTNFVFTRPRFAPQVLWES